MVLIRGLNSHCPCPICMVPSNQLRDHTRTHPLRTSTTAMLRFDLYKRSRRDGDDLMRQESWRPVEVSTLLLA